MGALLPKEPVNILLVDDQPGKLLTYRTILEQLGENLITAGSGREALQHLLKEEVAIVLIDVIMPDLDGFELATMIRDHPRFERTAIIFVSAIALTDIDRLKGYERGAVDYVQVPVVPELLRAKVGIFAELYRKTRQLELLNAELERRVEERTAELARANLELERRVEERTRERESALAQVHEMQKLESLGQLTGGVAHDFNNVLMAILGNLEVISQDLCDSQTRSHLVADAIRAAERGAGLVQRMLAFARRQELMPEIVDVRQLVSNTVDMLRRSVGPTIEISLDFPISLEMIQVDPNQLELAIVNLVVNARDAMPEGGSIVISARRRTAGQGFPPQVAPGEYLCLSVKDMGPGMDDATLKRAPEPFFTTKGPGKGTGLGLSMVFGLAAQSGGMARILSDVGIGTIVELWFPIAEHADKLSRPASQPSRPEGARSCRIVVVDDDPDVLAATIAMVEELGHRPVPAPSGLHAMDIIRSDGSFELVITDHAMPNMSGIELAKHIGDLAPGLPVILATGYAGLPNGVESKLPRLTKPFRLHALAALIAEVIGSASTGHPGAGGSHLHWARPLTK